MFVVAVPLFLKWAAVSTAACIGGVLLLRKKGLNTHEVSNEILEFVEFTTDQDVKPEYLKDRGRTCRKCGEKYYSYCWECY